MRITLRAMFNDGHISTIGMQPDPFGQQPQVAIDPITGMPANVIIMQPPSVAPKVFGILIIIYGSGMGLLSILGLFTMHLVMDPSSELYQPVYAANQGILYGSMILFVSFLGMLVVGGTIILKRQKKGIYLCWYAIGLIFISELIMELLYPEISAADSNSMGSAINIVFSTICNIICGLIVAIPLMISNNGMDNNNVKKLIGFTEEE